jgi:hypothetical protein
VQVWVYAWQTSTGRWVPVSDGWIPIEQAASQFFIHDEFWGYYLTGPGLENLAFPLWFRADWRWK